MPLIMVHSAMAQPIARVDLERRTANQGEITGEVDCPTFIVELTQEEIETSLEDDAVIEGEVEQEELVVEIEEDDC